MVFEFGRRMGEEEPDGSPSKRLKRQHTSSTTSSSRTPARPLCPPPSPWRRNRIRPATPPTLPGNTGAGSWPPPPAVLAAKVTIEGRVAQMESRGTGQTPREDRWWTLPVTSGSGSSSSSLKTDHVPMQGPHILARVPWVVEREGVHLPPDNSLALRLFTDTNHHHPPALPLLPSSQRKTGSAGERNIINITNMTSTTATRESGRKKSSSSTKSGRQEASQEASQEDKQRRTSKKSSSSTSKAKTETYLHWARLETRPVTPLPESAGSGSSSSSSLSARTASSSSTSGWSSKGFQGAQTLQRKGGNIVSLSEWDSSTTAECASRTFVPQIGGKTTAGPEHTELANGVMRMGRLSVDQAKHQILDPWGLNEHHQPKPRGGTANHLPEEDQ